MFRIVQFVCVVCASLNFFSFAEDVGQSSFMPMVAFLCRRPAMHLTEDGWKKDEQIDCLSDAKDILEYCKHVYPKLDVRYVVEASDIVHISNWCKSGREKCSRHTHAVRPFRCLVKPFISDALLVPKNCIFDHIHESSQCKGYSDWDVTAGLACTERGMFLKSFAMIQPCDVNKFAGTEFVCCPGSYNEDVKKGKIMVVDKKQNSGRSEKIENKTSKLLNSSEKMDTNEVEVVKPAEEKLDEGHKKHLRKVTKQVNKSKHVSVAAKTKTTTQPAKQPVVKKNTEVEKQLKMLDEQKKVALENYLKTINEEPISVARVLSTLKKYVKIQQKERIHAIDNFKESKNSKDGEEVLEKSVKRLKEIDQATEEALQMLEKIPKHGKKMRQHMDDYIHNLPSIDESLLHKTSSTTTTTSGQVAHSSLAELHSQPTTDNSEINTVRKTSYPVTSSASSPAANKHLNAREFDPMPAHMARNQLNVEQPHLKKISGKANMAYVRHSDGKMTNPVGIILTSIGLVLIVVIGIVALIKRVNSVPVTNGYLDKPAKRGEGLRKSSMSSNGGSVRRQNSMNGYENPTYRYFEAHVNP